MLPGAMLATRKLSLTPFARFDVRNCPGNVARVSEVHPGCFAWSPRVRFAYPDYAGYFRKMAGPGKLPGR